MYNFLENFYLKGVIRILGEVRNQKLFQSVNFNFAKFSADITYNQSGFKIQALQYFKR